MCAGNELFFCMLYLVNFTSGPVCKYKYIPLLFHEDTCEHCNNYCLRHQQQNGCYYVLKSGESSGDIPNKSEVFRSFGSKSFDFGNLSSEGEVSLYRHL